MSTRTASCSCGQLQIRVQGEPGGVGGFADPSFPPPQDSVYDCRRHAWVTPPPGCAVYEKDPE
jgi:hypothetical protein